MTRILLAGLVALGVVSCSGGGDTGRYAFRLELQGLGDLGVQRGHYEGWAVVNGVPVSTGRFIIDESFTPARVTSVNGNRVYGNVQGATFGPASTGLGQAFPFIWQASHFFVTIEPEGDLDLAPSGNIILSGTIANASATLSFSGERDVGVPANPDLSMAAGDCVLANPTGDGAPANGIWFSDDVGGGAGLTLAPVSGSWRYEGWVIDPGAGAWYSTGQFFAPGQADLDAQSCQTRGAQSIGFLDPGQGFVNPGVTGESQALALDDGDWDVFITAEPFPDNAAAPFPLRLLDADIPTDMVDPMTGLAVRDLDLTELTAVFPQLAATATPGMLVMTGQAPADLGAARDGIYAAWASTGGATDELVAYFVVDGAASQVTSVDGLTVFGTPTAFTFDSTNTGLPFPAVETATAFYVTVEAQATPAATTVGPVLLYGAASGGVASLTVTDGVADFSGISGSCVTMTPTNDALGVPADDRMGLWFRALSGGPSLVLPALPVGWRYQAWVENPVAGVGPHSLGRFSNPLFADDDAMTWPGRGPENTGFQVPGQDFLVANPGTAIPGPLDLTVGLMTAITLEPFPDTSSGPSPFVILDGPLPAATLSVSAPFTNQAGATLPTGSLTYVP